MKQSLRSLMILGIPFNTLLRLELTNSAMKFNATTESDWLVPSEVIETRHFVVTNHATYRTAPVVTTR